MPTLYESRKRGRKDAPDAAYLDELTPPSSGRRLIFDAHKDAPRGFGIRITTKGRRAFVLRYNAAGKDRLLSIGDYPTWSLTAARKQAEEYRREIDTGTDLLEQRRIERAELTVKDAAERFFKAKAQLASSGGIKATLSKHLLPEMGAKKLKDVRRRDVIAVVEALAARHGRQAALLLTYTKQLFAWAEDREIIDASPVATLKAGNIAQALAPRMRARVLTDAEVRALWNTVEPPTGMREITLLTLKLILVTGQRPGEVAGMRWEEIHGATWTIPATRRKTGSAHTVPLTDTALELLERARALARDKAEYVFEPHIGKPLTSAAVAKAVLRCAKALGNIPQRDEGHWRPHDLRRTCRTGLSAAGINETVAELTIGHTRKGIAAVYDLHKYDAEKRTALEAWERRLLRIGAGDPAEDNVVAITEGRA